MSYYGNILTAYQVTPDGLLMIERILHGCRAVYKRLDTTFFVETTSRDHTRQVIGLLTQSGIIFTFFHLKDPNGSAIRANGIDQQALRRINDIMFSENYDRRMEPLGDLLA